MPRRPALPALPLDVMGEVMKRASQDARIACLTVSKAWHCAAMLAAAWDAVRFEHELDGTALDFMLRQPNIRYVYIVTHRPDDAAWFFDAMADAGLGAQIHEVHLAIGPVQRVPTALLRALSRHSELRTLEIDITDINKVCEVAFPPNHSLAKLQRLRIREHSDATRQLVVWFGDSQSRFKALEHVHLEVGVSDILAGVDGMKALRHLTYLCDDDEGGETYEDVNLKGANLDHLEIEVGMYTDVDWLYLQLQRASIRTLVLHVFDNYLGIRTPLSPDLRHLVLGFRTDAVDFELDFPTLRDYHPKLEKLTVAVTANWILEDPDLLDNCHHNLIFRHIPNFAEWLAYVTKVHLDVAPTTRISMIPPR